MPLVSLNNEEANYDTVTLLLCATNFLTFPKLSFSKRLILIVEYPSILEYLEKNN